MEANKQTNESNLTVADSVCREINYFYSSMVECLKDGMEEDCIPHSCSDYGPNIEDGGCKFCGKPSSSKEEFDEDLFAHILSSAALYGLILSTGSLVNSQLSTTCPRLQKNGESKASLTFGSFVDMIHTVLKPEAVNSQFFYDDKEWILRNRTNKETMEVKEITVDDEDDNEIGDVFFTLGQFSEFDELREDEANQLKPPLCSLFDTNCFIDTVSRLSLSGGSMHTCGLKYKCDDNVITLKDDIPLTSELITCKCREALVED